MKRQDFADASAKADAVAEARGRLSRKRRIKDQVSAERHRPPPPLAGTPLDAIQIVVRDTAPHVLHAASPADIRAVLSALPDAAEGLARIELSLGKAYMEKRSDNPTGPRDPHTGRLSRESFPGVYNGEILGCYRPDLGRIAIYAYVWDPLRLPLPQAAAEIYLRLHALKTLVHEVAHHHDEVRRVRRGRWLADRPTRRTISAAGVFLRRQPAYRTQRHDAAGILHQQRV